MIFTRIMIHSQTWTAHLSSRNGIKRVVVKKFQLHQWLKSPFLKPNLMKPGVEKEWSACCMMWGQTPSKMSKQKWIWKRPLKKYIHKWAYQYLWKRWFFSEQYCGDQIWQSQIGSFCSYQLTEANSVATVDISSAYTCHKLYEITPKKKVLIGARENKLQKPQISQNEILHMTVLPLFSHFLWKLKFIFLGSRKQLSLVLLQITNYISTSWKV